MLTLPEELLLIALDNETGKMTSPFIHYGLAGAVLMELTLRECIDVQNKKLIILEKNDAGDELLNEFLQHMKIKQKGRAKSLYHWVQQLGRYIKRHKKHQLFIDRLLAQKILKREEKRYWLFFTKEVYPAARIKEEHEIRNRLKKTVLTDHADEDERTITLLAIIHACRLARNVFMKEEHRLAKRKMNEMLKKSAHGKAVASTIETMQIAVAAAIASAVSTSTYSSNTTAN